MPRLPRWLRVFAVLASIGFFVASVVALTDRDWLSAFLLLDVAAVAGISAWKGRDVVDVVGS